MPNDQAPEMEPWRRMDALAQAAFLEVNWAGLEDRLQLGEDRYQSHIQGFQGHPFDRVMEEVLDMVVYSHWLGKYIRSLEEENRNLKEENQRLKVNQAVE